MKSKTQEEIEVAHKDQVCHVQEPWITVDPPEEDLQSDFEQEDQDEDYIPTSESTTVPSPRSSRIDEAMKDLQELAVFLKAQQTYICEIEDCQKTFTKKGDFQRHKLVHSNERQFACTQCDKKFKLKGELKRHQTSHSDSKKFSCTQCKKTFTLKGNLDRHTKTVHEKQGRSHCPFEGCGKSFSQSGDLNRHMKIHQDERPFACDYPECDLTFRQKAHLLAHLKTHQ